MKVDPYATLGVPKDADGATIKEHPQTYGTGSMLLDLLGAYR